MYKRIATASLIFGMAATAPPAFAANCAMRDILVKRLQTQYSESFAGGGLQASATAQTLVEVWVSKETGTFTVILTSPQGISCVVAAGTDWFDKGLQAVSKGIPS